MAKKKVMFEINDDEEITLEEVTLDEVASTEEDTEFFEVENDEASQYSNIEDEDINIEEVLEDIPSENEEETAIFEVEPDLESTEEVIEQSALSDDELFSGLSSSAEEETIIFEVENDDILQYSNVEDEDVIEEALEDMPLENEEEMDIFEVEPDLESTEEVIEQSTLSDDELFSGLSSSVEEEDTIIFEVENDEASQQSNIEDEDIIEEALEDMPLENEEEMDIFEVEPDLESTEEVIEQSALSDDELFLGLSSSAEEGDTIIFEKVESASGLEQAEDTVEVNMEEIKENNMKKKTPSGPRGPRKIRRKKKEKLGFNWFFWISLIIIAIPVAYFISLLVEASKVSHLPILGERIKNTIVYTINESDVDYISTTVKQLEGVENAEINLIVETLRITVDVNDDYTEKQIEELILKIYAIVDEKIPIATYFTRDGDYKQYDLDIMAFTDINSEEIIIINLIKNGSMEEYTIQVLSRPVNPELVDRLKEEQNPVVEEEPEQDDQPEENPDYDPEVS